METKKLEIKNFNGRTYQLQTYTVKSGHAPLNKLRPLAIVVPGGSFTHLSVKEGEPVALAYVSRGFNACVVSYNLLQDEGMIYPDAGLDVLSTVNYYRERAAEYQIDPNKIVTIGFSAGGHIVSAANYLADEAEYQERYGYEGDQVRPNATILGYPLTDVHKVAFEIGGRADGALPPDPKLVDTALGVSSKTPPTFIFQSWNDPICLPTNAMAYEKPCSKTRSSARPTCLTSATTATLWPLRNCPRKTFSGRATRTRPAGSI
jgi:acetyl esterase/lipase